MLSGTLLPLFWTIPEHLWTRAPLLSPAKSARECHPPRPLLNSTYNEHSSCQMYLWQAGAAADRSACCCANAYILLLLWLLIDYVMPKHLLCRYAAYSIMPHTSPERSSAARSSVQSVTIPAGANSARSGSVAEDSDSLCIDNGILLVNFSKATGHMVALENRQAKVSLSCIVIMRLRMLEAFVESAQDVSNKLDWHQCIMTLNEAVCIEHVGGLHIVCPECD